MSHRILIVEDEPKLARSVAEYFTAQGYQTHTLDNGGAVADWVRAQSPSLILLDLMLPGKDGVAVCQELRSFSQVPIIMVTARNEEIDRLIGLEIGADDYVCKPFSLRELAARVKAVLRRHDYVPVRTATRGLTLEKASSTLCYQHQQIELTAIEFNIMEKLVRNPGRIFKRDELIDVAYSDGRVVSDRTVDSHLKKIRRKLQQVAPDQKFLHTIYGTGYKFEP